MPPPGRRAAAALPRVGTWTLTRGEGSSLCPLHGCPGAGTRRPLLTQRSRPSQPAAGGWGRWLRSAPAPAPLPGPDTGTGGLGRPSHRSASWARFCRPSVRGTGGLLRRGFAVCRAPLGSHRRGWGLCERQLRSPPVMDGDKVEIDGGIMEGVSTSGGLASPYLAPGSGDGRAGSRPLGGRCRSA